MQECRTIAYQRFYNTGKNKTTKNPSAGMQNTFPPFGTDKAHKQEFFWEKSSCCTDSQMSYCHVLTDGAPLAVAHTQLLAEGSYLFINMAD